MKKAIIVISVLLTACGSGTSPAQSTTNISTSGLVSNGISVPPEPNPVVNNATLLGVDSNNNGVRDDVERQIAATHGGDANHYDAALRAAKSDQEYLIANGDPVKSTAATSHAVVVGACMNRKFNHDAIAASKASRDTFALSINTPERMAAYRATIAASTEVSTQIPAAPCQ